MIELADNVRVQDSLTESSQYKYYKFFKACGDTCDLEITVEPLQTLKSLSLLVDVDKGTGKLPTMASKPMWSKTVVKAASLDIQSNDPLLASNDTSYVLYLIGVYSA